MSVSLPGVFDFTAYQGDDFIQDLVYKADGINATNLTGYTFKSEIRPVAGGALTAAFTVTSVTPTAGTIRLVLTNTVSAAITPGAYVYDLQIISSGGIILTILKGAFNQVAQVTTG